MKLLYETLNVLWLAVIYITEAIILSILPRSYTSKNIEGEVALVTGGAGGIGRLIAMKLSMLGAHVIIWDINESGTCTNYRQCAPLRLIRYSIRASSLRESNEISRPRPSSLLKPETRKEEMGNWNFPNGSSCNSRIEVFLSLPCHALDIEIVMSLLCSNLFNLISQSLAARKDFLYETFLYFDFLVEKALRINGLLWSFIFPYSVYISVFL